jgi:glycine cleavage system aminomethyltransferase T
VFLPEDGGMSQPVGVVTSSTLAPMLGADPVAFAMIRSQHAEPGTRLLVTAEGAQVGATVCELCFSAP